MGVKYLWSILAPVCEQKSLWEIQDKTLAIDLSGWVCESQNVSEGNKNHSHIYLRNLFFRTNCLLLLGVRPVFVLEGKAPQMKNDVIDKRRNVLYTQSSSEGEEPKRRVRSRLNSLLNKCEKLLRIMGVFCTRSPGEAEALCGFLNQKNLVDGCISQDGDCFLYGANTVYRNLCISSTGSNGAGFSIDVYSMRIIDDRLSLNREELIALSLLCGCDYKEEGVKGVGKERVLVFLSGIKGESVLDRMKRWRSDPYFKDLEEQKLLISKGKICGTCGHKGNKRIHQRDGCFTCHEKQGCVQSSDYLFSPACAEELFIRKKALLDPEFPSEQIIEEFLYSCDNCDDISVDKSWKKPDFNEFIKFASVNISWATDYAIAKFLPLMTRWQLTECCRKPQSTFFFEPEAIVKKRTVKGVKSYEIKWNDVNNIVKNVNSEVPLVTIEPEQLFAKAYPSFVNNYFKEQEEKVKKGKKKKNPEKPAKDNRKRGAPTCIKLKYESYFTWNGNKTNKCIQIAAEDDEAAEDFDPRQDIEKKCQSVSSQLKNDYTGVSTPKRNVVRDMDSSVCSPLCKYKREELEWEDCHICCEDDDMNLSDIVDSIVNRKTPSKKKLSLPSDNPCCLNSPQNEHEQDESFDEFDLIATEDCLPLIERIKLKF